MTDTGWIALFGIVAIVCVTVVYAIAMWRQK